MKAFKTPIYTISQKSSAGTRAQAIGSPSSLYSLSLVVELAVRLTRIFAWIWFCCTRLRDFWPEYSPSRLKGGCDRRDLENMVSTGCRMLWLSRSTLVTPTRLAPACFRRLGLWGGVDLCIFRHRGWSPSAWCLLTTLPPRVSLQELKLQTSSGLLKNTISLFYDWD